jgi:tRNA(Ile)-lysidine synthase
VVVIDRARLRQAAEEIALRVLERAILAAGGGGERVALGKLEAVLGGVREARVAAPGKWTLARALITAEASAVRIEREPGREPLPELTLAPGTAALWDGRFRVWVAARLGSEPVQVRPLGEATLRGLRRRGHVAQDAPVRAAAAVPSVWYHGNLIAVPPLRYWASPHTAADLEAVFLGAQILAGETAPRSRTLPKIES